MFRISGICAAWVCMSASGAQAQTITRTRLSPRTTRVAFTPLDVTATVYRPRNVMVHVRRGSRFAPMVRARSSFLPEIIASESEL